MIKRTFLAALLCAAVCAGQCAPESAIAVSYRILDPASAVSPGILVSLSVEDPLIEVFIVTLTFQDASGATQQTTQAVPRPMTPRGFPEPKPTVFVFPITTDKVIYLLARGLKQGAGGYVAP
jgi:hypothetical protein